MNNKEFDKLVFKANKLNETKVGLAKLMNAYNLDIRSSHCNNGKTSKLFVEIYCDFYEDGDPILLYSTENKNEEESSVVLPEDLIK